MRDALQEKEAQYMTDYDLMPNSFEQNPSSVGASILLLAKGNAGKSVVPGSSHDKGGLFPVFADSKPILSNDRSTFCMKGFRCQHVKNAVIKISNNKNIN